MKSTIAKKTEGYGYKYTELADINKYCEDNEIRYYQEVETNEINQKDYIITYLVKGDDVTKHRGCQIVEAVLQGIKNPVQAYGSSLTYCRRYSLLMALGLATEDDDGASLTEEEMTEEKANEYIIDFGKYKGTKLTDLINSNMGYVKWMVNDTKNPNLLKAIELLTGLKPKTEEEWDERLKLTQRLQEIIVEKGLDMEKICQYYKVETAKDLTEEQMKEIIEKRG